VVYCGVEVAKQRLTEAHESMDRVVCGIGLDDTPQMQRCLPGLVLKRELRQVAMGKHAQVALLPGAIQQSLQHRQDLCTGAIARQGVLDACAQAVELARIFGLHAGLPPNCGSRSANAPNRRDATVRMLGMFPQNGQEEAAEATERPSHTCPLGSCEQRTNHGYLMDECGRRNHAHAAKALERQVLG